MKVTMYEVGPRDGLQNESLILPLEDKLWLIDALSKTGLREIESGSFVKPDRVPQMADSAAIAESFPGRDWYLVPNQKGLERALSKGVKKVAFFSAVSKTFNQKNIGMTPDESFEEIRFMMNTLQGLGVQTRIYLSTVWGCPFEGNMSIKTSAKEIERMLQLNPDQISIGDTIGIAHPKSVQDLLKEVQNLGVPLEEKFAVHFHDTRGTALANAVKSLEMGVTAFDSSVGGLGGCPFAPGAAGNLATEDLLYCFKEMGVETGVSYSMLCNVGLELMRRMNRRPKSKSLQAYETNCAKGNPWDR